MERVSSWPLYCENMPRGICDYLIVPLFLNQECSQIKWHSVPQDCVYSGDCHIILQNFFHSLHHVINDSPHKLETSKLGKE